MEEMKMATIVQLMNENAARKGITTQIRREHVVKLPNATGEQHSGMPILRWEIYATRVEDQVCLLYWYSDGRIHVFFH